MPIAVILQDSITGAATEEPIHEVDPANGVYNCSVDLNAMLDGDMIELKLYDQVVDGTYRLIRSTVVNNVQTSKVL